MSGARLPNLCEWCDEYSAEFRCEVCEMDLCVECVAYGVTEAGVFGTAGDPPGAPQLLMYWSDDGAEAGKAAAGTALAMAAVVDFSADAAEVAVTVGGNIVFGSTDPATEEEFGSTRYATAEETGDKARGGRSVTPKGLHAAAGKVLATLLGSAPGANVVYELLGKADGSIVVRERTADAALSRRADANAAAITGLATRVTALEGRTLAVGKPSALADGAPDGADVLAFSDVSAAGAPSRKVEIRKLLGALAPAGGLVAGRRYQIEALAGGILRLAAVTLYATATTAPLFATLEGTTQIGEVLDMPAGNYYMVANSHISQGLGNLRVQRSVNSGAWINIALFTTSQSSNRRDLEGESVAIAGGTRVRMAWVHSGGGHPPKIDRSMLLAARI